MELFMFSERVGIGSHGQKTLVGHVLGSFSPEERPLIDAAVQNAAAAVRLLVSQGFQAAANQFNTRKQKASEPTSPAQGQAEAAGE